MTSAARMTLMLIAALAVAAPARGAEPDTYIFDVLRHGQYRLAFKKLFKDKTVPDWVTAVVTSGEGVAVPARTVELGRKTYRIDRVCKVHDCAGNVLAVLWSPAGQRVTAAVIEGGAAPVFFGTPSPDETEALLAAAKGG